LLSWPGRLDLALHIEPLPAPTDAARLRTQRARFESSRRADAERGKLADPYVEAAAEDAAEDAADLAERLARGAAKLFRVGLYATVHARTEAELADACAQVKAAAAATLLQMQPATWRHLAGWTTTLPLATDGLRMLRTMDTQALAAAFPLASLDAHPGAQTRWGVDQGVAKSLRRGSVDIGVRRGRPPPFLQLRQCGTFGFSVLAGCRRVRAGQGGNEVNTGHVFGVHCRQAAGNAGPPVAAGRAITGVTQTGHQFRPGAGDALDAPAGSGRLGAESVPG
jgi:hypothetical protein